MSALNEEIALDCGICMGTYNNPHDTSCKHTFCKDCISAWIRRGNNTCPLCRGDVKLESLSENQEVKKAVEDIAKKAQEVAKEFLPVEQEDKPVLKFDSIKSAVVVLTFLYRTACAENKRTWKFEGEIMGQKFYFKNHYDPNEVAINPETLEKIKSLRVGARYVSDDLSVSIAQTKIVLHRKLTDDNISLPLTMALSKAGVTAVGKVKLISG